MFGYDDVEDFSVGDTHEWTRGDGVAALHTTRCAVALHEPYYDTTYDYGMYMLACPLPTPRSLAREWC